MSELGPSNIHGRQGGGPTVRPTGNDKRIVVLAGIGIVIAAAIIIVLALV